MLIGKLTKATAVAAAFVLPAQSALTEEFSAATFVCPSHRAVTGTLAWFVKDITERSVGTQIMEPWVS